MVEGEWEIGAECGGWIERWGVICGYWAFLWFFDNIYL